MHDVFMKAAFILAEKSHCVSHHVGAVIVKDNRIISMGYNGTPPGLINCDEKFNKNNFDREEHHKWSKDNEVHSEINCLLFAAKNDIGVNKCDMYVTISPCNECLKNIAVSGIKNVYYLYEYDKSIPNIEILRKINLIQLKDPKIIEFVEKNNLYYISKPNNKEDYEKLMKKCKKYSGD